MFFSALSLFLAAREQCESRRRGVPGAANGPQQIHDQVHDIGSGRTDTEHWQCPLFAGGKEWHILFTRQRVEFHHVVQVSVDCC
jgi:hypothetical protein